MFFYRSCNPMTKYVYDYSEPDPVVLAEFGVKRGVGELQTGVIDWRTCITSKTDVEIVTTLDIPEVDAAEKKKKVANFERFVAAALAHQVADVRFDPPDLTTGRNLVFGPDHKIVKVGDSPLRGAQFMTLMAIIFVKEITMMTIYLARSFPTMRWTLNKPELPAMMNATKQGTKKC